MQKIVLMAGLAALALTACALQVGPRQIPLSGEVRFDLLPPQSYGESRQFTEIAELRIADERHELLLVSEITDQAVTIVGLMPNGTRLFTIHYDGSSIESDGDQRLLSRIRPAFFLADFQLSRWPLALLRDRLGESSSCFRQDRCQLTESADSLSRSLLADGREVLGISYAGLPHHQHAIRLVHHDRGYRVDLSPVQ